MCNIKIMSHKKAIECAAGKDVLLMSSPEGGRIQAERVAKIKASAREYLHLEFHDIPAPRPGLVHPTLDHVKRALEWGKGRDLTNVICVCQMGVSRSSAMAFLLAAQQDGPREAVKILDITWHNPNPLIVGIGAELLKDQEIINVYKEYDRAMLLQHTSDVPLEIIEDTRA